MKAPPGRPPGGKGPFFLFLNYFDPHGPCRPPKSFAAAFAPHFSLAGFANLSLTDRTAFCDAEILFMDTHIGRLFDSLREGGLYDGAMIVVTADHGELLGERGRFGHGGHLSEEELSIPLIVKHPRGEAAPLVAEVCPPGEEIAWGDWRALYEGRYKALWNSRGHHRLFDLERDPGSGRTFRK